MLRLTRGTKGNLGLYSTVLCGLVEQASLRPKGLVARKLALTVGKSGVECTAEVLFEVAYDLFLNAAFQQGQNKSQVRLYPDFVFTHCDHAV